jgi:acyl-CoA synthetase (AMP-forming)/AMP-acid ligase II
MQALLESADHLDDRLRNLRCWACSGEALSADLMELFHERLPYASLYNVYGTSEFWDASWSVANRETAHHRVSIGRPIANMRTYVLHDDLQPAPVGVAGALYIGGAGLARGYLMRPDLTAERFVPSPFGDGERLYRTGDRACWRQEGELEYLGRDDHQIKLRGFRIELGEIEAGLRAYAGIRDAVVVVREDAPGDKGLIAYVVGTDASSTNAGELRSHLKQMLPDYMVPSAFVKLEALPLTPNGKVNRGALPAPQDDAVVRGEYVAPGTPTEEALAAIWGEALKLARVGVHDNFFDLGGHSLLLTQVHARLVRQIGRDFPIALLFQYPTIHSLGNYFLGQTSQVDQMRSGGTERGERRRKSSQIRRVKSMAGKPD